MRVSGATSEIIRKPARDLKDKPNRSAQSLRSGRSKTLTVAAPFPISFATSTYYASVLDGLIRHASAKGYTICLSGASLDGNVSFEDSKGKFDGVIWLGNPPEKLTEGDARVDDLPQIGIHLESTTASPRVVNVRADEVQAIINFVGHQRVSDYARIGLFAKAGDSKGLLAADELRDLCKRLAIEFFTYEVLAEVNSIATEAKLQAGVIWHIEEASELAHSVSSKGIKGGILSIVSDSDPGADPKKHFIFPINEMCRSAIELITLKIENPPGPGSSVGLPIPFPS